MDIVREEHHRSQIKRLRLGNTGIELKPSVPPVTPNRLDAGRAAFDAAYHHTMKVLAADAE